MLTECSMFAFYYNPLFPPESFNGWNAFNANEFSRHGISWGKWRMSEVNKSFTCEYYPREVCVPAAISDETLLKVTLPINNSQFYQSAKMREDGCWPQYTWSNKKNSATIYRAGTPLNTGRSSDDAETKIFNVYLSLNRNSGDKLKGNAFISYLS